MSTTTPDLIEETDLEGKIEVNLPWQVIVSNDPVNLFVFVQAIFQKVLHLSEEVAYDYTNKVHTEGKCAVFSGSQEECQQKAIILMSYNLWTHVEKSGE